MKKPIKIDVKVANRKSQGSSLVGRWPKNEMSVGKVCVWVSCELKGVKVQSTSAFWYSESFGMTVAE